MTPTRDQLDRALKRYPAGISALGGDLTDDEERSVALDWLEEFYAEAARTPDDRSSNT